MKLKITLVSLLAFGYITADTKLAQDLEYIQKGMGPDTNIVSENNSKASKRNPDKHQSPWIFELKNKATDGLIIQLRQGDRDLLLPQHTFVPESKGAKESEKGYLRLAGLSDIRGSFRLYIWRLQPGEQKEFFQDPNRVFRLKAQRKPNRVYDIKANPKRRTILLTYEKDELRPQEGSRLKGMVTGYGSSSGLPMFANIEKSDIKLQ